MTAYTIPTLSGYNATPPTDDGQNIAANEVTWAGIKNKLGDPLKTYTDAINTNVSNAFINLAASGGSALVGYLQSGTGAVARTVEDKLQEIVSASDFKNDDGTQVAPIAGRDNTTGLQKLFNLITTSAATNFADVKAGNDTAINIIIPPGTFEVSGALSMGAASTVFYSVSLFMHGAVIESTYAGAEAAFTAYGPHHCYIGGLNVRASGASAVKIVHSKNTKYDSLFAGSNDFASLEFYGVFFNNVFENVNLNQNNAVNGSDWSLYANFTSVISPYTWGGAPVNVFNGLHMAGAVNSIYWNTGSQMEINSLEMEGYTTAIGAYVGTFLNITGLKISGMYGESYPNPAVVLLYDTCVDVVLENIKTGSYYHEHKIKNCKRVKITNMDNSLLYEGTNEDVTIDGLTSRRVYPRQAIRRDTTGTIDGLDAKNIRIMDTAGTVLKGKQQITTGTLAQTGNLILNPRGLDSSGSVTTTYCATTDDAGYQDVSPLGFIETLVTIDAVTNYPIIQQDIDTTAFQDAEAMDCVLVQAFLINNLPAGITGLVINGTSGAQQNAKYSSFYGDFLIESGDWLLSYTLMTLPAATTYVRIVWDYNTIFAVGDKFLFGGAILYPGSEIKLPL